MPVKNLHPKHSQYHNKIVVPLFSPPYSGNIKTKVWQCVHTKLIMRVKNTFNASSSTRVWIQTLDILLYT